MLIYPDINPIALSLGPIKIYWYGIMYLLSFILCWGLLAWRIQGGKAPQGMTQAQFADLVFYAALGVIIGGRLGYMLFYARSQLIADPLSLVQVWHGGMSFHGGLLGVIIAVAIFAYQKRYSLLALTDFIAPVAPIGLGLGRLGNFINGELWGRVTTLPWGMVYPQAGPLPRHPSELYELFLEGILLFIILWCYSRKPRARGAVSGLFLIGYGIFRFAVEFCREPDPQLGFVAFGWMSEGQLLSLPLIILGIILYSCSKRSAACNNT